MGFFISGSVFVSIVTGDLRKIFRICWTWHKNCSTVPHLIRLFHAPQSRRGGCFRSRSVSCWIFLVKTQVTVWRSNWLSSCIDNAAENRHNYEFGVSVDNINIAERPNWQNIQRYDQRSGSGCFYLQNRLALERETMACSASIMLNRGFVGLCF